MMLASDNFVLCTENLLLTAALSSNQTALLPLANLQDPIRLVKTRLNGVTNVQITVDLGSAQDVQAAILFDTNMTATGTVQVRSSTDNFSSSDTLEGTITIGSQPFQLCHPLFFDSVNRRYWRFVCDDASNPDGYIEWGMGYLGALTQFIHNFNYGAQLEVIDGTQVVRSPSGAPHRTPGPVYRRVSWSVSSLAESEAWTTLLDLLMRLGIATPCFLSLWPQHATADLVKRGTLYGQFTQLGNVVARPTAVVTWSTNQLVFEES